MADKGSWAATAVASVLVAENEDRSELIIQHQGGSPVFIAFDDDVPVVDGTLRLWTGEPTIVIDDYRKGKKVNAICDAGLSATGAYLGA